MTEEEKREFEEFLKWKADRAKKQEEEKQSVKNEVESTYLDETSAQTEMAEVKSEMPKAKKNNGNTIIFVFLAIVFFLFIKAILLGLNNMNTRPATLAEVGDSITESIIDPQQDSIAKAERISEVKKTIKITSSYLGRPNSASGVDAYFYYKNLSDKTIKYLFWEGYPMNAVGDRVSCEIRGYRDFRGKDTGPVKPGKSSGGCWECAWYNSTAKKLVLTGIEIEYMDGSTFAIKENEIELVR